MGFITKVPKKSVEPIEESDLTRIKNYQLSLIDTLLYEAPLHPQGQKDYKNRDFIYAEISNCEVWLKINWNLFMNDNHRQFDTPTIKFSKPERAKLRGGYNRNLTF